MTQVLLEGRYHCVPDASDKLAALFLHYGEVIAWKICPQLSNLDECQFRMAEAEKSFTLALDCNTKAKLHSPKASYADQIKSETFCALGKLHRKFKHEFELAKRRFSNAIEYDETNATVK